MARSLLLSIFAFFCIFALASAQVQQGVSSRKLLQGWPEPPINVDTPSGPLVIRRYPFSVQNLVGGNVFIPNFVQRGRGSAGSR